MVEWSAFRAVLFLANSTVSDFRACFTNLFRAGNARIDSLCKKFILTPQTSHGHFALNTNIPVAAFQMVYFASKDAESMLASYAALYHSTILAFRFLPNVTKPRFTTISTKEFTTALTKLD
jgi:hypothetical protein